MDHGANADRLEGCVGRRACSSLRLVAGAAALAVGLLGCGKPASLTSVAPAKPRADARHLHQVQRASRPAPAAIHFMTYALNVLLVPLLDDDSPPRWTDPALSFDCEAVDVSIDGAPLDTGAPVPEGGFTVRWRMQRCMPLGNAMEITGDVELRVEPDGAGYHAVVRPIQLHVLSGQDHEVLTEAFTASMRLGR